MIFVQFDEYSSLDGLYRFKRVSMIPSWRQSSLVLNVHSHIHTDFLWQDSPAWKPLVRPNGPVEFLARLSLCTWHKRLVVFEFSRNQFANQFACPWHQLGFAQILAWFVVLLIAAMCCIPQTSQAANA